MAAPKAQTEITFKGKWEDAKNKFNQTHGTFFEFNDKILNFKKSHEKTNEIEVYLKDIIDIMNAYKKQISESSSNIFSEDGLYDMIIRFSLKNKQIELNNKLASLYNAEKENLVTQIRALTTEIETLKTTTGELEGALNTANTANTNTSVEMNKQIEALTKQLEEANTKANNNAIQLEKSQKTSNDSITELLKTLQTISFTPTAPATP